MKEKNEDKGKEEEFIDFKNGRFEGFLNLESALSLAFDKLSKLVPMKESYDLGVFCKDITESTQCKAYTEKRNKILEDYKKDKKKFYEGLFAEKKDLSEKERTNQVDMAMRRLQFTADDSTDWRDLLEVDSGLKIKKIKIDAKKIRRYKVPENATEEQIKKFSDWNLGATDFRLLLGYIEFTGEWPKE